MDAITFADAPEFGHGEVAERPMAAPKVRRTNESAAARKAPARTAPHSTKLDPGVAVTLPPTGAGPTCVIGVVSLRERQWSPRRLKMNITTTMRPTR
jgi:hypothetical protein